MCYKHVVLTSQCHDSQFPSHCDVAQLGLQSGSYSDYSGLNWDISSAYEQGGSTLWQLIEKVIDVRSRVMDIMADEDATLSKLLKEHENNLSDQQRDWLRVLLSLVTVYIYCCPCARLIHTALRVCDKVTSSLVKVAIRPDDRLVSSCCTTSDRIMGLKSVLQYVHDFEKDNTCRASPIAEFLDRIWVERRLDHLEYELPYQYTEDRQNHVIILGEADYLGQFLQKAPGRIPKETEIWAFQALHTVPRLFTRQFICTFFEKRRKAKIEAQLGTNIARAKRTLSPASSENKRQKNSTESEDEKMESGSESGSSHVLSIR